MFRNILVLSDLTDTTDFAFAPVAALARHQKGVRVVLAHAVIGSTEQFFLDDAIRTRIDKKAMDKARPKLEEVAARMRAAGVDVETALEIGSPFNVLFQLAERYGADCIVVPTRHQHSVVRRVSNSVTARAIRAHALPVMTMNQHFGERAAGFSDFRTVVHPVDFGSGQRDGLKGAGHFAEGTGASLELVHVIRPFHLDDLLEGEDEQDAAAARAGVESMQTRAEQTLADVLSRVGGVKAEARVLTADAPGEGICAHAEAVGADAIVLPALGRDKVRTQLMGSVAEYLIAHAPCPVLFHDGHDL